MPYDVKLKSLSDNNHINKNESVTAGVWTNRCRRPETRVVRMCLIISSQAKSAKNSHSNKNRTQVVVEAGCRRQAGHSVEEAGTKIAAHTRKKNKKPTLVKAKCKAWTNKVPKHTLQEH